MSTLCLKLGHLWQQIFGLGGNTDYIQCQRCYVTRLTVVEHEAA